MRARLWTQGISRNKEQIERSSRLTEDAAIELGAEIIANGATLIIGIAALVLQQSISAAQDKKKHECEVSQMERIERGILEIQNKVFDQGLLIAQQDAKIRELERKILALPSYGKIVKTHSQNNKAKS